MGKSSGEEENSNSSSDISEHGENEEVMINLDGPSKDESQPNDLNNEEPLVDAKKYRKLKQRISTIKSASLNDLSGATVSLKNVSYELDVPLGGAMETMADVISPKTYWDSAKDAFHRVFRRKEPRKMTKQILKNVSFAIRPGTMTLLLGAPGSGKSTLMKLIANQMAGGRVSGELRINGVKPKASHHHHYVAYVTQYDLHLPTLTVEETAQFASLLQGGPNETKEEKLARADEYLHYLGLSHRKNTIIGNDYLRGLSGGEKKRMTIAVTLLKQTQCLLLDEPTTGLDATTSLELFKFCNVIKELVPVFACPLQPSSDIFFQFDNLVLLDHGRVLYAGPINEVLPYFEKLGYPCPPTKNPADFLLEVVESLSDPDHQSMAAIAHENTPLYEEETPEELQNMQLYNTSFWIQLWLIVWRGFALIKNFPAPYIFRIIKSIATAFIYGSLWWKIENDQEELRNRSSLIFSVILYVGFASLSNIATYFEQRPVYYMQRRTRYYSAIAYYLGTTIVDTPICLIDSVIFGSIIYWMAGMKAGFLSFFFFLSGLFLLSYFILSVVRLFCFGIENIQTASQLLPLVMVFQLQFSGFVVPKKFCWVVLRWVYWLSVYFYGNQALNINEYVGLKFHCRKNELLPPKSYPGFELPFDEGGYNGEQTCQFTTGEQYLESIGYFQDNDYKIWYILVVVGFLAIFQLMAFLATQFLVFPPPPPRGAPKRPRGEKPDPEDKAHESTSHSEAYMTWKNISYSVEVRPSLFSKAQELVLLNNINGHVAPGMMLALMGPSGAGKSTLLDILGQRKTTGKIKGEILVNGKPINPNTFSHIIGYVEQQNLHIETASVREAIEFSAALRLLNRTAEQRREHVEWVLKVLELDLIQDNILFQLSFEQMKRVTIGVELAADPDILLLDEPTSGLDARAAAMVIQCVKNAAAVSGKAVICTIHQPAESVFRQFTHLLLLKNGRAIYCDEIGDNYSTLLPYFEKNFNLKPRPMQNPADFILDMCSYEVKDPAEFFSGSEYEQAAIKRLETAVPPGFNSTTNMPFYATNFFVQLYWLTLRGITNWWRQPQVIKIAILSNVAIGLIVGMTFFQLDLDQQGFLMRFNVFFFMIILCGICSAGMTALVAFSRATFTREQAAAVYHPAAYILGLIIARIPVMVTCNLLVVIPAYFLSGMRTNGPQYFFFLLLIIFATSLCFMAMYMACGIWFPNLDVANGISALIISMWAVPAGFIISKDAFPDWWIWLKYLTPLRYAVESLYINEFVGLKFHCPHNEGAVLIGTPEDGNYFCPVTDGTLGLEQRGFDLDWKWRNVGVVYAIAIIYIFVVIFGARYIKYVNR